MMRSLVEAQREVLDAVEPLPVAAADLDDAFGLALADDVFAPHDVPPFANSAMDGFAVLGADVVATPVTLDVIEHVPAGSTPTRTVTAGTAVRIMTGAPMPAGADTVVPIEDTESDGDRVRVIEGRAVGANVRGAGSDMRAGDPVMAAGTRLDATGIAVLASLGVRPEVRRRPVVAVFSTGDELHPADTTELPPGAIRDSNRPLLRSLLTQVGCNVLDLGIAADDEAVLRRTLGKASTADLVVGSGGVSMGDHDLVKRVVDDLGSIDLWKVAMKPGKPFAFGTVVGTPFFGLPGNPVSVFASFEQFVRPALLTMLGASAVFRARRHGTATTMIEGDPIRLTFARVVTGFDGDGRPTAASAGGQGSHVLSALGRADAFAVVPGGVEVGPGDDVELEMFSWPEARTREEALG